MTDMPWEEEEGALEDSSADLDKAPGQAELHRWNQRFSDPEYVFGTEPNAFLAA